MAPLQQQQQQPPPSNPAGLALPPFHPSLAAVKNGMNEGGETFSPPRATQAKCEDALQGSIALRDVTMKNNEQENGVLKDNCTDLVNQYTPISKMASAVPTTGQEGNETTPSPQVHQQRRAPIGAAENQPARGQGDDTASAEGTAAASMPPPAVPASMLADLMPSSRARQPHIQLYDLAISSRLVAAVCILCRMGDATRAMAIGQFTLDLVGKERWDAELQMYMDAPRRPEEDRKVPLLLNEAALFIKPYDAESAGFLDGMRYALDEGFDHGGVGVVWRRVMGM